MPTSSPTPVPGYARTLAETVEARVREGAGRLAVRTRFRSITYGELNRDANRLAHALLKLRGAQSEPVALLLGDDIRLVIAMLAVVKAGKFYIPLDASHPPGRLAGIVRSSGAVAVLTDAASGRITSQFENLAAPLIDVDAAGAGHPDTDPGVATDPDALAQVLFTSGSTGEPKGVMHSHRAVLHTQFRHTSSLDITAADRLTLLGARSSAQCMTGVWKALVNGCALFPYRIREDGLPGLADWLAKNDISIYTSSASVFRYFSEMLPDGRSFPKLRVVQLGGEPIARHDFQWFQKRFPPGCVLVNTLSATEAGSIRQNILRHDEQMNERLVPVGYPLPDVEVVLRDDEGRAVPPGEVGEIYVRSAWLARGYWQQPALTDQYFLPDPDGGDRRLFRTGDLGRIGPDGKLEHLGRKDFCLKIRGNRVELAEIEATLLEAPGVRQQTLIARDDEPGEPRIVAYIVPSADATLTVPGLRGFLAGYLPDYMIPSAFVFMEALPVTPGGKVDRKALPPPPAQPAARADRVMPSTLLQTQLHHLWAEELGITDFGVNDDFFDLGGNSLLANRMFHRVEQECGQRVVPANILPGLTIERLVAELIRTDKGKPSARIVEIQRGTSQQPFFYAHADIESGGFYCRRLAQHLGPDLTFHALMPHGLDGGPVPISFQDMAEDFIAEMKKIQPSGPYLLGGYCNGGLIVYEMARRLRARGEQVPVVLMVDARAYNAPLGPTWRLSHRLARFLGLSQSAELELFRRLRWLRADVQEAGGGIGGFLRAVFRRISRRPKAVAAPARAPAEAADDPAAEQGGLWPVYHSRVTVFVPERYDGKTVLFRSSHIDQRPPGGWDAGWAPVATDLEVHRVPGSHRECLTTHAPDLAARMRSYLDAALSVTK
ncbi:MAG: AMP-binding protein [Gammaproteobacteria bacterium]|nr:AMP-binding protein [Gammaproteobacteria bacterium]